MNQIFTNALTQPVLGITGVGLITSVGHDAASTISSLKSDITRMQEVKLPAKGGLPLVGAPIVGCSDTLLYESRLWDLAGQAAIEAIQYSNQAGLPLNSQKCGILWTMSEIERPGFTTRTTPEFKQQFLEQLGMNGKEIIWHEIASGHASGIVALQEAAKLIALGKVNFCLIGGTDSLLQLRVLRWLEPIDRLKTEIYTDGLIPGEAAAFIVVEPQTNIERRNGHALAWINGVGISHESATILSDQPCRAQGLTQALRSAFAESTVKSGEIQFVFCDLNGESYRANEWAITEMRVGFSENIRLIHPADCIGDVGAANGSLLLAYAAVNIAEDPFASCNALVFSGADNGSRAAAILTHVKESKKGDKNQVNHNPYRRKECEKSRDFSIELYQEHLSEASFLYEQRLTLFDDPEITWLDIEDFEDRFEPHIDGLVVGEELALEVCKQQAIEGDFGELHAAVRVFCRQNRKDLVLEVLEGLDPEDAEKISAVSDALKYELPASWQNEFIQVLSTGDQKRIPIIATVAGYQRLAVGKELFQALQKNDLDSLPVIVWALGRIREKDISALLLRNYLQHEEESICAASALALLRMDEQLVLDDCIQNVQSHNWPLLLLGLCSSHSSVPVLMNRASTDKVSADCLISLGLLGDITSIDMLLVHLTNDKLAESAAITLNLITGAELYEEAFIPEEIDKDELFEEELEAFKKGKVPTRPDGKPFGTTITRLSQKPEDWRKWWTENKKRFITDIRYRNGKPYSPACLLENLESEKSPNKIRQLAYEELVIRYDIDFPFETDMLVVEQKKAIAKYAEWIKANEARFQPGKWYFAGQIMPS